MGDLSWWSWRRWLDWRHRGAVAARFESVPVRTALYVALLAFAAQIDSQIFRIGEVLDLRSRILAARILGPDYPERAPRCRPEQDNCPKTVADTLAVVLFDDNTLNALRAEWPAPYANHAAVLEGILAEGPTAVFVDILFVDKRPDRTLRSLVRVIEAYRAAQVPLIFAAPPRDMQTRILPQILTALGDEAYRSPTSVVLATPGLIDPDVVPIKGTGLEKPGPDPSDIARLAHEEYAASLGYIVPTTDAPCETWPAAFDLAHLYLRGARAPEHDCKPPTTDGFPQSASLQASGIDNSHPSRLMELRWSGRLPLTAREGKPGVAALGACNSRGALAASPWLGTIVRTAQSWLGWDKLEQRCPPIASVRAAEVLEREQVGGLDGKPQPCPPDDDNGTTPLCFKDRIVLYGADISAARDRVETPIAGRLPGVYVHAMALDNILTFDLLDESRQQKARILDASKRYADWALVCAFCFLGVMLSTMYDSFVRRCRCLRRIYDGSYGLWPMAVIIAGLGFVLAGILSFVLALSLIQIERLHFIEFSLPPINWLSIQFMVTMTVFFDHLGISRRLGTRKAANGRKLQS